jgi:acetolactate synthase-1/2/3 large subunit
MDVPVDIQGALIEPEALEGFNEAEFSAGGSLPPPPSESLVSEVLAKLKVARRPVILVGNGVRLSGALEGFYRLADRLKIPVCPAWMMDFIPTDYPYFCGIQGTIGDRAGNFVVQNSDFVLILGSRLQIRQVSYNWKNFARHAFKVHVDIDRGELEKPTLSSDIKVWSDLKDFIQIALELTQDHVPPVAHKEWLTWGKERVSKYHPVVLPAHREEPGKINPYSFFEKLSRHLTADYNVVAGNASACVMSFPTLKIHPGQRLFTNAGSASMGYDLPAAIGAAFADPGKTTLCLAGDGSVMMNIQELQTLAHYGLNLKVLVINNSGYVSIKATQSNFFGRLYGEGPESGVTFPDFCKVGAAFGLNSLRLEDPLQVDTVLTSFLGQPGPGLLDVIVDPGQTFEPKLSSKKLPDGRMVSAPLEDMWPFLDRVEFKGNMLIPIAPESEG